MTTLYTPIGTRDHIVAQIIKAKFRIRAIGNIGLIGWDLFGRAHAVLNKANLHPHELIDATHPLRVACGQVIVYRNNVHVIARQGIEIAGQRGNECFTFAGFHLGDFAIMQGHATNKLHIKVAQPDSTRACLTYSSKGFRQYIIELFARIEPLAKLNSFMSQIVIRKCLHRRLEGVDLLNYALVFFKGFVFTHTQ